MGAYTQFHDDVVQLKRLPTEVFHKHYSYCRKQALHDNGFEKINELCNFKGTLASTSSEILPLICNQKIPS